jgi:bacterioferritin
MSHTTEAPEAPEATKSPQRSAASDASPSPRLRLNEAALDAARHSLDEGAVNPSYGPWREEIIDLLNGALATELVCVLRYKRHYFTAAGIKSISVAEEFLVHANEESAHADKLAERIVQLGGEPDFCPDTLSQRAHASYDDATDLPSMIRSNLVAERVAIEAYSQMIALVGDKDPTTRRMLEDILQQEQEHADELKDWLTD